MDELMLGAIWYVVLIFSLTFHEAGHAWAAMRGGDLTAYLGGQVSLDPMPHIRREPFGTVLVPLLSFAFSGFMIGWASTPYDPRWANAHPRRAGWMSLSGPAANLILVVAAGTAIRFGMMIDETDSLSASGTGSVIGGSLMARSTLKASSRQARLPATSSPAFIDMVVKLWSANHRTAASERPVSDQIKTASM